MITDFRCHRAAHRGNEQQPELERRGGRFGERTHRALRRNCRDRSEDSRGARGAGRTNLCLYLKLGEVSDCWKKEIY